MLRDWFDFDWYKVSDTPHGRKYVRRNPVEVYLITFAIVFGIGWLIALALTMIISM